MKNFYISLFVFLFICLSNRSEGQKGYITGDFHQHTTYTDGSWSIGHVMSKNNEFGLDWWANSEHGGGFTRDASVSGLDLGVTKFWDSYVPNPIIGKIQLSGGHQAMWRWQSLKDYSFLKILEARQNYPSKVILQSYEMNVPGHEHGSVGIINNQFDMNPNCLPIAEFEFKFDNSDSDNIGGMAQGWTKSTATGHAKTLEAISWLQANYQNTSYLIPAHPERKGGLKGGAGYTIAAFRDMNNAGPDVCFGFESVPGHQKDSGRGGYGTGADGEGTFGGAGYYSAIIGGLWDAMLSEGRKWWLFASSDFHDLDGDFYPGEYQKTYTYVSDKKSPQEIINGLRSGNSWVVEGDLIDVLDFRIQGNGPNDVSNSVSMGGTVRYNQNLNITIIVHDPNTMNHNNENPVLDHIDLIMGKVTGLKSPGNPDYNKPSVETTKVIARFDATGGNTDANGLTSKKWTSLGNGNYQIKYEVKQMNEKLYFRLRGTNQKLNEAFETDANGNPLSDNLAANKGLDGASEAWADLWFYSNPIFAYPIKKENNVKTESQANPSLDQKIQPKNISAYPNPASNTLHFGNLSVEGSVNVTVYNFYGRKVLNTVLDNNSIDISGIPDGYYSVRLTGSGVNHNAVFFKSK